MRSFTATSVLALSIMAATGSANASSGEHADNSKYEHLVAPNGYNDGQSTAIFSDAQIAARQALAHDYDALLEHSEHDLEAGNYAAAAKNAKALLAVSEQRYGYLDQHTKKALSLLGVTLQATGNFEAAKQAFRRVVTIDRVTARAKPQERANNLNNLANLLRAKGEYSEAEGILREVLKIDAEDSGDDRATHLNNLALVQWGKGELPQAEETLRKALAHDERGVGAQHPDHAVRLSNLASLLRQTGKLDEAEMLLQHAMKIDADSYGTHHPKYATRLNNMALVLKDKGDLEGAKTLYSEAVLLLEESLGADHPNSQATRSNLEKLLGE